jgi:pimeloyl-ACP methyl ester carboxylesterase
MVDGAGHLLPQQRPDLVADAIRRAAKRAPAGNPG